MTNEERIKDLERRVKELEDAAKNQSPWSWPITDGPEIIPWIIDPNTFPDTWPIDEEGTRCPKCNMLWKGIMGYCCPDHHCPMGAGPTML